MNKDNSPVDEIIEALRKAPGVALFSHVSPDGDCIGSTLALGLSLEKIGKEVSYYNPDPVPNNLKFLPSAFRISRSLPKHSPQTWMFVDCTDLQRVNLEPSQIPDGSLLLNVDHHISNSFFGDVNWVDSQASASGEIVMTLIKQLGVEIDRDIATNLYTAMVTDSGCFQYSNTTAQTHRLTAELLDVGLDLTKIHHNIFDQKPLAQLKLLQAALDNLKLYAGGQLAIMSLSLEDFKKNSASQELSEGLVDHIRSIAGVEVAVLLKEVGPQEIKAGFRSNLWLNVNEVAAHFGGGGHKRAAGCTLRMPMLEAKQRIRESVEEVLGNGWVH